MVPERAKVILVLVGSALLVAVALVIVPGRPDQPTIVVNTNTPPASTNPLAPTVLLAAPLTAPAMPDSATNVSVPQSKYTETIPALSEVPNLNNVLSAYKITLSDPDRSFLNTNKFVLVPLDKTLLSSKGQINFDEMLAANDYLTGSQYNFERLPQNTRLVTPDVVLHAYHRFFENSLEDLEQNYLYNQLDTFLIGYVSNLEAAHQAATGNLAVRYDRILGQAVVAKVLLETHFSVADETMNTPVTDEVDKASDTYPHAQEAIAKYTNDLSPKTMADAKEEIRRIYESSQVYQSDLFAGYNDGVKGDYTQYTPRSHYNKNSVLRSYFRSMMYLGRNSYFFKNDNGITDSILVVLAFNTKSKDGVVPRDNWQHIMEITGFYAGQSDDVTYNEWSSYVIKTLGVKTISAADAVNPVVIKKLGSSLTQLRLPKILSDIVVDSNIADMNKNDLLRATLGFRLFGQRFTFDAWVLNQLTAGQEDPAHPLPSMPSATFIPAAFGSARAKEFSLNYLTKTLGWEDAKTQNFQTQLAARSADLKKVKLTDWFSSLGTAWLYVLEPLTKTFGSGYPAYMQSAAFVDKSLTTWLGSYTELKHDTVLYAKQSYAELGGGGPDDKKVPPVVKGFVEPNIVFWKKLNSLVDYNIALFDKYGLKEDSNAGFMLDEFKTDVSFYELLAEKEITGAPISEDEYEKLRTTKLMFMAPPIGENGVDPTEDTAKVALVTDVHTDGLTNQILYEGTGIPYLMLAVVGNENSPRVVSGLVFNHYEFTKPLGKRLTDEQWKDLVYKNTDQLPPRNFWYEALLAR